MSERTKTIAQVTRWSIFVLALPITAFASLMGWVGTGFGGLIDSLPLLLMLPAQACAFFSFRLAATGLWVLLAIHLLLPFRFGSSPVTWRDLAPARIDPALWAVAILMAIAARVANKTSKKMAS
jgi:hypothetical protein